VNILITTGIYPPDVGGPAKFVPLISLSLSKFHNLKIITLSDKKDSEHNNNLEVLRIIRKQNKFLRVLKTIASIIKNGKNVDVIFVNGLWLETYIANLILRKRIVRKIVGDPIWEKYYSNYEIDDGFDEFQVKTYGLKIQFLKFIRNISIKSADTIIVPSNHLLDYIKNINSESHALQVNNGTQITKNYEKNKVNLNFLIVSRLVRHKNIDLILKSMVLAKEKYNIDFYLNIVGDGPEYEYIESLINKLDLSSYVNLAGSKYGDELDTFYKTSNFFLQISSYEGMPHSILEAMNRKLTVIASNFGGNYELLVDNDCGYVLESYDEESIAKVIFEAVKDPSSKVEKNKELIASEFDIKDTIKKYTEIILNNG